MERIYNEEYLKEYDLSKDNYLLVIARLEPENNIFMAIEGYIASNQYGKRPLVIIGKTDTPYGKYLVEKYKEYEYVKFVGGIYAFDKLNSVRHYSYAYFHGHSVGGTNPSLLEAMAAECFILSHDNIFNRSVLGENAVYYGCTDDAMNIINNLENLVSAYRQVYTQKNLEIIRTQYSWDKLVEEHEKYFQWMLEDAKKRKEDSR